MANTFSTPKSSKAIGLARVDYNDSVQALLSNFYSPANPTSTNITIENVATVPPSGTLYRSSTTGVLYIKDINVPSDVVYSGFTANGVGSVTLGSLTEYIASNFELGQLFKTTGSNARLYMKSTTAGAIADIGLPASNTVTATMLNTTINLGSIV